MSTGCAADVVNALVEKDKRAVCGNILDLWLMTRETLMIIKNPFEN